MLDYLLALCPSFLHVLVRRILGAKIGAGTRIGFGTILRAKTIDIGKNVSIGPFALLRANALVIGDRTQIKAFSACSAGDVRIGRYVYIASTAVIYSALTPRSRITVGDHCRFGPFCWIEPGEGIDIGNHVGIGGHALVFTHGVWADFLNGGPVSYGPVVLEDDAWLAWQVFVLPNVVIGKNAIVGPGAVVTKSVPPNALASGMLAKVVDAHAVQALEPQDKLARAKHVLEEYPKFRPIPGASQSPQLADGRLMFGHCIAVDSDASLKTCDLLFLVNRRLAPQEQDAILGRGISILDHEARTIIRATSAPYIDDFVVFVRRYGIRLTVR